MAKRTSILSLTSVSRSRFSFFFCDHTRKIFLWFRVFEIPSQTQTSFSFSINTVSDNVGHKTVDTYRPAIRVTLTSIALKFFSHISTRKLPQT